MGPSNLLLLLLLASCARWPHVIAERDDDLSEMTYCGGDLWGYFGPVRLSGDKSMNETAFMGVAPVTPTQQTFLFTYALQTYRALELRFESTNITYSVNGAETTTPFEVLVQRTSHPVTHYYPRAHHDLQLADPAKNKWRVVKLNPVTKYLFAGEPFEEELPKGSRHIVTDGKISFPSDKTIESSMLIIVFPTWPITRALTDAKFQVRMPGFSVNGQHQQGRTFDFDFNHKAWRETGKAACPSLAQLFWSKR